MPGSSPDAILLPADRRPAPTTPERVKHAFSRIPAGVAIVATVDEDGEVDLAGLVLAAVLLVWRGTGDRRRATAHLALALVAAGVLAGSWYVFSAPDVRDYLTGYGYGVESTSYGATAVASVQWWLSDAVAVVSDGLYLPVTVVLALGATAGAVTVLRGRPRGARLAAVLDSDALPVVVAVATGFGATGTTVTSLPAWITDTRIEARIAARPEPVPVGVRLEGPIDDPRKIFDTNALQSYLAGRVGRGGLQQLLPGLVQPPGQPAQPTQPGQQPQQQQQQRNNPMDLLSPLLRR